MILLIDNYDSFTYNLTDYFLQLGQDIEVIKNDTHTPQALQSKSFDAIVISPGPNRPKDSGHLMAIIDAYHQQLPILGICLGHQILALASGASTYKMKFGHHGANHPVKDLDNGRVCITSQNHGFAVDDKTLPSHIRSTHISLFDGSLQGLALKDKPAFSFQGHPEASPGPHDIGYLFDRFIDSMMVPTHA